MDFVTRIPAATDIAALAALREALWPEGDAAEHAAELHAVLQASGNFIVIAEANNKLIGFVEARLRSHADGCETSPVGYLEGWFVVDSWRGRGVGRALVQRFEEWAAAQGCRELASDTWLDNAASQRAHEKLGFQEVDRVITYRKALDPDIALGPHAQPPLTQPPGQ